MSPAHGLIGNGAWRNDPSNILKIDDKYHVWYARFPARGSGFPSKEEWNEICFRPNYAQIWMATSEDGHHWTEHGQVLPPSKPHAWHERCPHAPYVVPWNGNYYLFFSAYNGPRSYQRPGEKHIGLGVAGIVESNYLAYSSDGLNFRLGAKIPRDLANNSVYCPDVFDDAQKGRGITWGLCMTTGGMLGLRRFDCDLRTRGFGRRQIAAPDPRRIRGKFHDCSHYE